MNCFFKLAPLLILALVGTGCRTSPQAYFEKGNQFADAGKLDDAAIQYRKALQKDPKLGEAHYRLGLLDLKKGLLVQAYQSIYQAAQIMPANDEVQGKLGELCIGIFTNDPRHPKRYYDEAAKIAELLIARKPDGFESNQLKGALSLVDRKPGPAIEFLRKAEKAKPGDRDTNLGLAQALVGDGRVEEGLDLARAMIAKDKTTGAAYDFLFRQYVMAKKLEEAEAILKLKVANNPKQADPLMELARYYAIAAKPTEMTATLQKLLGAPADFPDSRIRVGDFYTAFGKRDEALKLFREGLAADAANRLGYQKRIAHSLAAQGKFPEAIAQLDEILKEKAGDQDTRQARAMMLLDGGKPENVDPAIAELNALIQLKPSDLTLHHQLGLALSRKGDTDGARKEWTAAARGNRSYLPPRLALASMELAQGKPQAALKVAEEIMAVAPDNPEAQLLNANCLIRVGRIPEARAILNRVNTSSPQNLAVRYQLGVLAIAERKFKQAEDIFHQLQEAKPGEIQVIGGLIDAYGGQNQPGKAKQLVEEELKRAPNSQALQGMLAQLSVATGDVGSAIEQYKKMSGANPKSVELQMRLAEAYLMKSDPGNAISVLEKATQTDPKSIPAAMLLAQSYELAGKNVEAKTAYRRAQALQPDEPRTLNNLAYLMLETGDSPDEALTLAQRGLQVVRDPGLKASLTDTVGWAYMKQKKYDEAVRTLQSLVRVHAKEPTFHYHLGAALYEKGDKQLARTALEAALAAKPQSAEERKIRELLGRL